MTGALFLLPPIFEVFRLVYSVTVSPDYLYFRGFLLPIILPIKKILKNILQIGKRYYL